LASEVQKYVEINANDDETPIEFVKKNSPLLIGVLVHIYAKDLEKSNNKNKRELGIGFWRSQQSAEHGYCVIWDFFVWAYVQSGIWVFA
jgi:hypothetical protein